MAARRSDEEEPSVVRIGGVDYALVPVRHAPSRPGIATTTACPTLEAFAAEYLATRGVSTLKPSSLRMKQTSLRRHALPALVPLPSSPGEPERFAVLGQLPLDQITGRMLARFQADLLRVKKLTPKSTNNVCSALRSLLKYAAEEEVIAVAPKLPHLTTQLPQIEVLTAGQAADLLGAAAGDARVAIALALFAGLRIGEIAALRWSSVDLPRRSLVVCASRWKGIETAPKSNKDRRVELAAPLARILEAHHPHGVSPYVLCRDDGEPFEPGGLKWGLWRACAQVGLERFGYHRLRHTCATLLVERGVPLRVVQTILGHGSIGMTERYAHVAPRQVADAVSRLDDLGEQPTGRDK